MKYPIKIGIIGGSGLDDPDIISDRQETEVETPYGKPSDVLIEGKIKGVPCVLLARHGRRHDISPTDVNYRANIWALRNVGCTHVVVSTACGSLQEHIQPGDFVVIDDFIDRTTKRHQTLYDAKLQGICHLPMEQPFCQETRSVIIEAATNLGLKFHPRGVAVTIEGPRFSTKSESLVFKSWGAEIINMTTVPEVVLAKEAGLCYAAVAMVTDYDCWRDTGEKVSVSAVMATFKENVSKVVGLLKEVVPMIAEKNWDETINQLQVMVESNVMVPK